MNEELRVLLNELQESAQEVGSLIEILYGYTEFNIGEPDISGSILVMLDIIRTKHDALLAKLDAQGGDVFEETVSV